jgi:hypothetical protein
MPRELLDRRAERHGIELSGQLKDAFSAAGGRQAGDVSSDAIVRRPQRFIELLGHRLSACR